MSDQPLLFIPEITHCPGLVSCPFCGCSDTPMLLENGTLKFFECEECGARGGGLSDTVSGAIVSWNSRVYPPNLSELIFVCGKLLEYRKNNTINFQLEKLDDYLALIRAALEGLETKK